MDIEPQLPPDAGELRGLFEPRYNDNASPEEIADFAPAGETKYDQPGWINGAPFAKENN